MRFVKFPRCASDIYSKHSGVAYDYAGVEKLGYNRAINRKKYLVKR